MEQIQRRAYSYIQGCIDNVLAGKHSDFQAEKFKEFGAAGIEQYFLFGEELVKSDNSPGLIVWYTGLFQEIMPRPEMPDVVKGMLDAFSTRSAGLASFISYFSGSSAAFLMVPLFENADLCKPDIIKSTLWLAPHNKYIFRNPRWAVQIVALIRTALFDKDELVNKAAIDCAIALALPQLMPEMVQMIIEKTTRNSPVIPEIKDLFKILLYTMWWPGPNWNPDTFELKETVKIVLGKLQKFPVTIYTAKRLDEALKVLKQGDNLSGGDGDFTTDWSLEKYLESPNMQTIKNDALNHYYTRLYRWVDLTLAKGTFAEELPKQVRITVDCGAGIENKQNRIAIADFLAEMECYIYVRKSNGGTKEDTNIDLRSEDPLQRDLRKWLAMYFLSHQGKDDVTPQMLIRDCPDLISAAGIEALADFAGEMGGIFPDLTAKLEATQAEIERRLTREKEPVKPGSWITRIINVMRKTIPGKHSKFRVPVRKRN